MLRDELHAHCCPRCSEVWEHHPDDFKKLGDHYLGHTCPACGFNGDGCYDPLPPIVHMDKVLDQLGL